VPYAPLLRSPAAALQARYRHEALWLDLGLGEYLIRRLEPCHALEVRIWSETAPYRGTFAAVEEAARRFASGLRARGIEPGDLVTYQLPNRVEALIALYGIAMAGAVVVPIVHLYGAKEVRFVLDQLRPRLHVTMDAFGQLDYLASLEGIRSGLPDLEQVVVVGERCPSWGVPFETVVDADPLSRIPSVDPMAPAVIGFTSGTTADPKGVIHTGNSFTAEIEQLARYDVSPTRPILAAAPLAHSMGMIGGALLPLVRHHASHIIDRWDPNRALAIMKEAEIASAGGPPIFVTGLLDAPSFTPAHAALIERTGFGGAPVPPAVTDRAEAAGIDVTRCYGSTEHPTSVGSDRFDTPEHRKYTDGRALPGCDVRIVDDASRDVGPGEVGEILTRGPELFFGYTDPALTAVAIDPEGWYHTDDLGSADADGYVTITDRKKDIIIRGGENISAAEVEDVFIRLPGVTEVAVVAAPDARLGERTCAFYALIPGRPPLELDEVRAHFGTAGIQRQKWPEELRLVTEFPRTPSGKIKKHSLRSDLQRGLGDSADA